MFPQNHLMRKACGGQASVLQAQKEGPSSLAEITKTSSAPFVSAGTRFEAVEVKARTLPSGVSARASVSASASAPSLPRERRQVAFTQAADARHVSWTNASTR